MCTYIHATYCCIQDPALNPSEARLAGVLLDHHKIAPLSTRRRSGVITHSTHTRERISTRLPPTTRSSSLLLLNRRRCCLHDPSLLVATWPRTGWGACYCRSSMFVCVSSVRTNLRRQYFVAGFHDEHVGVHNILSSLVGALPCALRPIHNTPPVSPSRSRHSRE